MRMRPSPSPLLPLLGGVLAGLLVASGPALGQVTLATTMTGAAEAPSAGSPTGSGLAVLTVVDTAIRYTIQVNGIATPSSGHIHKAVAGTGGGIVVDLAPVFTGGVASGNVVASSKALADDIAEHPDQYYVNVHNADFPAGALRGQLNGAPPKAATVSAVLTGAGEAPAAGSPDGGGVGTVTFQNGQATYTLLYEGISAPTASHIHRGVAGGSGPVILNFNPTFANGFATGTVPVSAALQADILANPSDYYINIHTPDFPGGAIRGPLAASATTYLPTVAKAQGLNSTNFVSDVRIVNPTASDLPVTVDYFAASDQPLAGPTATTTVTVVANGQAVVNDVLSTLFQTAGSGALRLSAARTMVVQARVINDLRASGRGTTGVVVPGVTGLDARPFGTIPLLSQASAADVAAGQGFRTNLGYFNPGTTPVKLTLNAMANDGTKLGTVTVTVPAYSRFQQPAFDMISTVTNRTQPDFYVSYTADGPIFVYAAVVDNATGDGQYSTGAPPK